MRENGNGAYLEKKGMPEQDGCMGRTARRRKREEAIFCLGGTKGNYIIASLELVESAVSMKSGV